MNRPIHVFAVARQYELYPGQIFPVARDRRFDWYTLGCDPDCVEVLPWATNMPGLSKKSR